MAAGELKETFEDYIEDNSPLLSFHIQYYYGNLGAVEQNAINLLNTGTPTLLVILNYSYTKSLLKHDHVIVAYGYKQEGEQTRFLAHFGWGSDTKEYTSVVLGDALFYG